MPKSPVVNAKNRNPLCPLALFLNIGNDLLITLVNPSVERLAKIRDIAANN